MSTANPILIGAPLRVTELSPPAVGAVPPAPLVEVGPAPPPEDELLHAARPTLAATTAAITPVRRVLYII
jgi:hypothetical protein